MRVGTKSLLFGVHQFFLHPLFVAIAWKRLYGFPKSFPLWIAFIVHDWGYFGKPNMDGPEGEAHPELGAKIMTKLFGKEWGEFTLCHSRFYSRTLNKSFSQLCVADKLASVIYPTWLYIFLARLTGEIKEYKTIKVESETIRMPEKDRTDFDWHKALKIWTNDWVDRNHVHASLIPVKESKSWL